MDLKSRECNTRLAQKQRFIAAALAGIGTMVSPYLTDSNEADLSRLQHLFDAARLFSLAFHGESVLRWEMLIRLINPAFKETLNEAEFGEFPFRADLLERVKAAKALQQSTADLKKPQASSSVYIPPEPNRDPRLLVGTPAGLFCRRQLCQ